MMKEINLMFGDAYIDDGWMWFFDNKLQSFCRMELDTGLVNIVSSYRREASEDLFRSYRIFFYGHCFYITTYWNSDILKYDPEAHTFTRFTNKITSTEFPLNFYEFQELMGDRIWLFPSYGVNSVYCFLPETESFIEIGRLNDCLSEHVDPKELAVIYAGCDGDALWTAVYHTDLYLKYDLNRSEIVRYRTERPDFHLNSVCFDGANMWLTQTDSSDIICVEETGQTTVLTTNLESKEKAYTRIVNLEQFVIALPRLGNCAALIKKETMEITEIDLRPLKLPADEDRLDYAKVVMCRETGNEIYLFPWGLTRIIGICKEDLSPRVIRTYWDPEELYPLLFESDLAKKAGIYENNEIGLADLISYLSFSKPENVTEQSDIGKAIHQMIYNAHDGQGR